MKKILVTTDFSANAKAGIQFALNLSALGGFELVFYYGLEMLKPVSWTEHRFNEYIAQEKEREQDILAKYLTKTFKKKGLPLDNLTCVVGIGGDLEDTLISYAQDIKADYICMSTRGAGVIKKVFGSTASTLVTTSPIPLIIVPHTYRTRPLTTVWYASDLENLFPELDIAAQFAKNLNAKIVVVNYDYWIDKAKNKKIVEDAALKYAPLNIPFKFKEMLLEHSLAHHLNDDLKSAKPALLILFTKQNRGWFDRIFASSNSADLAFDAKVPLVIFRKK